MKIATQKVFFSILFVLAVAAALWGFATADREESPAVDTENAEDTVLAERITWDEETITDGEGTVLVSSDDVPGSMQVSQEAEFGASGPFGDAVLSPDSEWIAFTTKGAAHDGGWLYEIGTGEIVPVAFQYGGGVDVLEWSPNARFVAFVVESPAPTTHIRVVDRENTGGYVSEIGHQIEVEAQADIDPPFAYEFVRWESPQTLCYTFEDQAEECIDVAELFSNGDS